MIEVLLVLAFPFTVIGWAFTTGLAVGLSMNGDQCALALDRFIGTCTIPGHAVNRKQRPWLEAFINWLHRDDHYCAKAYLSEMHTIQDLPDFRN